MGIIQKRMIPIYVLMKYINFNISCWMITLSDEHVLISLNDIKRKKTITWPLQTLIISPESKFVIYLYGVDGKKVIIGF